MRRLEITDAVAHAVDLHRIVSGALINARQEYGSAGFIEALRAATECANSCCLYLTLALKKWDENSKESNERSYTLSELCAALLEYEARQKRKP